MVQCPWYNGMFLLIAPWFAREIPARRLARSQWQHDAVLMAHEDQFIRKMSQDGGHLLLFFLVVIRRKGLELFFFFLIVRFLTALSRRCHVVEKKY